MLDINLIKNNPDEIDALLSTRGVAPISADLLARDAARRAAIAHAQDLQNKRNMASKKIGEIKSGQIAGDEQTYVDTVSDLKISLKEAENKAKTLSKDLDDVMVRLPNLPMEDVPHGADCKANIEVRHFGTPRARDGVAHHFDIGAQLGGMDFEIAAQISGARFVVLRSELARLERALGNFMLDIHTTEFGYEEISPPLLVREAALFNTGQLPKFEPDLFKTTDGYWLIPTGEIPLTNLVREQILDADQLPLRVAALTPCFRSEAGAAGRDTRGIIRQHQFLKVELVSFTDETSGADELERMTQCAEEILKRLEFCYRTMLLSSGDMGFQACKTYDLEVWLPAQEAYREVSSCSYCGDFQARRMQARYRSKGEKQTRYVHTLNGSGVAVGRALAALLETHIQADGTVALPDVLRPYMGGRTHIGAKKS